MRTFKYIRILILLIVLGGAYLYVKHQHEAVRAWDAPLQITLYPVAGDNDPATQDYISHLDPATFQPIADFLQAQATRYNILIDPVVQINLGPQISEAPPMPDADASMFGAILWSLELRYWAFRHSPDFSAPGIRIYLVYYAPQQTPILDSSLASAKDLIAVANVFASDAQAAENNIVITHEFLHTLGATDKYDLSTLLPLYPQGYGDPNQQPLLPQTSAEIMAGRMTIEDGKAVMPASLDQCVIGPQTAQEINWTSG